MTTRNVRFLLGATLLLLAAAACDFGTDDEGEHEPPTAAIAAEPASGTAPAPASVTFRAGDGTSENVAYLWYVNSRAVSAARTAVHEFTEAGHHTVRLEVTDEHGKIGAAETTYHVLRSDTRQTEHTLTPQQFGGYDLIIEPSGAWTATAYQTWLNAQPASGAGGPATGPTTITLTVDVAELPETGNAHTAPLVVVDADSTHVHHVTALLPELSGLEPVHSERPHPGAPTALPFTLANTGATSLTVALRLQGSGEAQAELEEPGGVIEPGDQREFRLIVTCPEPAANYDGQLVVTTNDPRNPEARTSVALTCSDAPPPRSYQLTLVFQEGSFTLQQQEQISLAADRWRRVVIGEIPNYDERNLQLRDSCFRWMSTGSSEGPIAPELQPITSFEGLLVYVRATYDESGALARAGPCGYLDQPTNFGAMIFNTDQLARMTTYGWLEDVALHELGHVLGIGTAWKHQSRELMRPSPEHCGTALDPASPRTFAGPDATREFGALGGAGRPIMEYDCAHWNEARFTTETMTPVLNATPTGESHNHLSRMTIGALADLGYEVSYAEADPYTLPVPGVHPETEGLLEYRHGDPVIMQLERP